MTLNKRLNSAVEAGKKGDYRLAVEILKKLISETDAPPEVWLLLGRSLHMLKDFSRALAAFNDYIKQRRVRRAHYEGNASGEYSFSY